MSFWYSPNTKQLYDTDLSGTPPEGSISMDYFKYLELYTGMAKGRRVIVGSDGTLSLSDEFDMVAGKAGLLDSIFRWRKEQESSEKTFEFNGRNWDVGVASLNRLKPCLELAQLSGVPTGFFWTDADNNDVYMSPVDITELYAAMLTFYVTEGFRIHARQRKMKEDIAAMTTPEEVLGYQIGWEVSTAP